MEPIGSNLHIQLLALKNETKCMEEWGYKIEKGGPFDHLITSLKWRNNKLVSATEFPTTWQTRFKINHLINQRLPSSNTSSSNTSSGIAVLSSRFTNDDEDDKMNSTTTDVAVLSSKSEQNRSCIIVDEKDKLISSTTDDAVLSSKVNVSTIVVPRDWGNILRTESSVQQTLTTTTSINNVVSLNYTSVLDQFSQYFCNNIIRTFEKETNNILMGVKLVLCSIDDSKVFQDVYRDMESRTAQHFQYFDGRIASYDKKKLKATYISEMHGFYTTMIDFCRAIITQNQLDLLPFQAQFHLESIIARSNDFSNYITREDELLVSLHREKLYAHKDQFFEWITTDPTSFLTKVNTSRTLTVHQVANSTIDKFNYAITTAANTYQSDDNPFMYAVKKLESEELLTDLVKKQLVIGQKINEGKYAGVKLNQDGSGTNSKKRKHIAKPTNELEKVVQSSLEKKQKIEKVKRKKLKCDDGDEDDDDDDDDDDA